MKRPLKRIAMVVAGLVLLLTLLAVGQRLGLDLTGFEAARARIAATLATDPLVAPIAAEIQAAAPEDLAMLADRMAWAALGEEDAADLRAAAFFEIDRYWRLLAPFAHQVPDEEARAVLDARIAVAEALAEDPLRCNRYLASAEHGLDLDSLTPDVRDLLAHELAQRTRALLIGRGSDSPLPRAGPRDAFQMRNHWQAQGATAAEAQTVGRLDIDDPALCPALISFLEAMHGAEGGWAARVRVTSFARSAGGG